MKSLFPDICSENLQASKTFYTELLGFKELVDIGWYIQLCSPIDENLQIAFVEREHGSVPKAYQLSPQGVVVTVEVDNVDEIYKTAKSMDLSMSVPLKNEPWGQRHFITTDPNGLLVDVYHMMEPDSDYMKQFEHS